MREQVGILMATYNGEKYIREQINSILSQTYELWHLYIHDDGSTDQTCSILQEYAEKHPNQITFLNYPPQGGAMKNFMSLLERVDATYYMFSDQDDVWKKDKIEKEVEQMNSEELKYGGNKPIIVFSDLFVVDSQLNLISESFLKYSGIHPEFLTSFDELAASNLITGCTMLFNHAAQKSIQYPYTSATMHDTWITLCTAKAHGVLSYLSEPLVYYRQHGNNTLGAVNIKHLTISYRVRHLYRILKLNKDTYCMMRALGYGSIIKYIYNKLRYKYRTNKRL